MRTSESKVRKLVREEAEKVLRESNRHVDEAKNHANSLMKSLTQAQMEDGGMRAKEISGLKRKVDDIIQKLNRL